MRIGARSFSAVCSLLVASSVGAGTTSTSAPVAEKLVAEMTAHRLDAIAAADPGEPGRYVAALLIPGGQLLVVSALTPSGGVLAQRIAAAAYRDAYLDLQGTPTPVGKFFVQDTGADGIRDGRDGVVDVVYEDGTRQTLFDRGLAKQLAGAAYDKALAAADHRYAEALLTLVDAAKAASDAGATQ